MRRRDADKVPTLTEVQHCSGHHDVNDVATWGEGVKSYLGRPHGNVANGDNPVSDGGLNREESAEVIVPVKRGWWIAALGKD